MEKSYDIHTLRVSSLSMINYCYIIVDKESREAAIVDPAWDSKQIVGQIEELGLKLKAILLTHSHIDHINKVETLVKRYNPDVFIHEEEIVYYSYSAPNLTPLKHLDEVTVGSTVIRCLHTPGHTKGGACYLLSDDIFTGDTLFIEGCGICTTKGGDAEEMFDSLKMLKRLVPVNVAVYPGHLYRMELGQRFGSLKKLNIYLAIEDREQFVKFRMRKRQGNLFKFK